MTPDYDVTIARRKLVELLGGNEPEAAAQLLSTIHPADQAALYSELDPAEQEQLLALLSADGLARLVESLDERHRSELIARLPRTALAHVIDRMAPDEAAAILRSLPPSEAALLLAGMQRAAEVVPLLSHSEESAGGLMTRGFVTLHKDMTAQEAISYLRVQQPAAQEGYYLYVLDEANRLQGVVSLRDLVTAQAETPLRDFMTVTVIAVAPETDQEECARLVQRYRLRALPVVDGEGVLQGIITADDLIDVLTQEATEDMYRMAGVGVKEWAFSPLHESVLRRVPWLSFNMVWAFAGASIISLFEGTIEQAAALAVFMPMIAGQAGNAGIQTATIVVRSMALGEVEMHHVVRLLLKEWSLAAIKGGIFGLVLGIVAWAWKGNEVLGIVAGGALFLNMLVAATGGVLVPMTLRRIGLDPAAIAGVFDTMLTDFMGFLIYLGLATLLLSHLVS